MKMLEHHTGGRICIEDDIPGNVVMSLSTVTSEPKVIGTYWDRNTAIADIDFAARTNRTGANARWVIRSAKTTSDPIPVFDGIRADAKILGMAATKEEADALLAPFAAAYVSDMVGPDGNEGWVPL